MEIPLYMQEYRNHALKNLLWGSKQATSSNMLNKQTNKNIIILCCGKGGVTALEACLGFFGWKGYRQFFISCGVIWTVLDLGIGLMELEV